jgi:hypothetical protein
MNSELQKFVDQIIENREFRCPVCGYARYVTDQGNHELILNYRRTALRILLTSTKPSTAAPVAQP